MTFNIGLEQMLMHVEKRSIAVPGFMSPWVTMSTGQGSRGDTWRQLVMQESWQQKCTCVGTGDSILLRSSGVHLHFWSGNEVYWKVRWESSPVNGEPMRTMVVYKDMVS